MIVHIVYAMYIDFVSVAIELRIYNAKVIHTQQMYNSYASFTKSIYNAYTISTIIWGVTNNVYEFGMKWYMNYITVFVVFESNISK